MAVILHIESSSAEGSICISESGKILCVQQLKDTNAHAAQLTLAIEDAMKSVHLGFKDIDALSYSSGPGSYTGLRIGLSTAKGICFATNKPLISVPTLRALCQGVKENTTSPHTNFLPMLDARRNDAYVALYDDELEPLIHPKMITVDEKFIAELSKFNGLSAFGSGAQKLKQLFSGIEIKFIEDVGCKAEYLVPFAEKMFVEEHFQDLSLSEPLYINQMVKKSDS